MFYLTENVINTFLLTLAIKIKFKFSKKVLKKYHFIVRRLQSLTVAFVVRRNKTQFLKQFLKFKKV